MTRPKLAVTATVCLAVALALGAWLLLMSQRADASGCGTDRTTTVPGDLEIESEVWPLSVDAFNEAVGSEATSGDAVTKNGAEVGTIVSTPNSPPEVGPITWNIVIQGDVEVKVKQRADATSGDALAGSQSVDIAGDSPGSTTLNLQNRATDSTAISGDATASNSVVIHDLIVGNVVTIEGDVEIKIKQVANAVTGDAVAGSQVVGIALVPERSSTTTSAVGSLQPLLHNLSAQAEASSGAGTIASDVTGSEVTGDTRPGEYRKGDGMLSLTAVGGLGPVTPASSSRPDLGLLGALSLLVLVPLLPRRFCRLWLRFGRVR